MSGREIPSPSVPSVDIGDVNARRAIDAPADGPLLAITGRAASGKSETLARRYVALLAHDATLLPAATIVTAASVRGARALAARIAALSPAPRSGDRAGEPRYVGATLDRLAFDMLAEHAPLTGLAYDLETIDAYEAQEIFTAAIAPLFSADWSDFLGPDIDPEIPGLRAPDRFATAVFRLIGKLRAAHIDPDAFLNAALRGATAFYASPPNLAAPSLLVATKDEHRSALSVNGAELDRQRRRELDLAKIIAKIYRTYLDGLVAHGCLQPADAIAQATRLLEEHPALARSYRRRFRIAIVDDVHNLHAGDFGLLVALFGKSLAGVTVAGDPDAATETFAGARPERVFGAASVTLNLQANYRIPPQIAGVVRALLEPRDAPAIPAGAALRLHRAASLADEAAFVGAAVAERISAGTPPGRIAVVHRWARALGPFEDALVDRDIPIAPAGDLALFARHDTLDALGLLWSTVDPFAHGWLLRVLQLPFLSLSDASLATLCGEPASPQALLFDLPPQDDGEGARRWDRRRDIRLGTNVVRGDRDIDLEPDVRDRLSAFRARRATWQHHLRSAGALDAARTIVTDGGMYARRPHETAARAGRRANMVDALLAVIARYAERHPGAELAAALAFCERIARDETGPVIDRDDPNAVVVASIDCIKGRRFEAVFVVDVRAGSFPRYYVPDAFLFSPTYGMIPKDSVGEALTARTAKFTWYMHHAKLRENYAREDRRALAVALTRADAEVTVSASGRPTRGAAAPELLVELQALRTAGEPGAAAFAGGDSRAEAASPTVASDGTGLDGGAAAPMRVSDEPVETVAGRSGEPVSVERVTELLRCVRCAARRWIGATIDASFTLLSGRPRSRDERIVERDVRLAFALDATVIYGTLPAIVSHDRLLYVAVARASPVGAMLAIAGLGPRVAADAFFIETTDGVLTGPHAIASDARLSDVRAVLSGAALPLCPEHQGR